MAVKTDPVGRHTQRSQPGALSHRPIGGSVGKLAPPVPAGHVLRGHNVTCVVLLQEQQEVLRPAQRAIDSELVRVRCGVGNGGIVNVEHQGLNGGTSDGPAQDGHRSLGGLSRQVDTYRDHSRSVGREPQSWRAAASGRQLDYDELERWTRVGYTALEVRCRG
jgi:hypothetical protein